MGLGHTMRSGALVEGKVNECFLVTRMNIQCLKTEKSNI